MADIPATLRELDKELTRQTSVSGSSWFTPIRNRIVRDIASYAPRGNGPFTVPGVLNILQSLMHGDDLLISDVGTHKMWIARNFSACCPNGCIISNGLASMGIALPGAVAASLYEPGRRIVSVMGDGGFLMNSQELETAVRLKLGFVVIIFNDNDYGLISWKQQMNRGRTTGTKISNPDFRKYAQSFGIKSFCPTSYNELRRQLSGALKSGELTVFEIPVDTRVNGQLIRKLNTKNKKGK